MSVSQLYKIYQAMCISTEKVLSNILSDPQNPSKEHTLLYLQQYIGNFSRNKLALFLRYATGSCVCTIGGLMVTFISLSGFARRPIAHTCACTLELPATYETYMEFKSEMDNVLSDKDSFAMSAM
uniref:HECT domain-containing protein n=1 Tax=Amphimedon queenslandica TaxID=400682 RepID=A0A1X7SZ26_AMPQE